MSDIISTSNR